MSKTMSNNMEYVSMTQIRNQRIWSQDSCIAGELMWPQRQSIIWLRKGMSIVHIWPGMKALLESKTVNTADFGIDLVCPTLAVELSELRHASEGSDDCGYKPDSVSKAPLHASSPPKIGSVAPSMKKMQVYTILMDLCRSFHHDHSKSSHFSRYFVTVCPVHPLNR